MFCGKCGAKLPGLGSFCPQCGAPVMSFPEAEPEAVMPDKAADGFETAPAGLKWDLPEEPEPVPEPEPETVRPVVWQVISEQKEEAPAEPARIEEPVSPAEPEKVEEPEKPEEPVKAAEEPEAAPLQATPGTPDPVQASFAPSSYPPAGEGNGVASLLTFCAVVVYIGAFIIGIVLGKVLGKFSFSVAVVYWAAGFLSGSMMLGIAEIIKLLQEIKNRR